MKSQQKERGPKHPFPLWARWLIALIVLIVIVGGTILWIIQGAQAFIPIAILTALGIIFGFFQIFPPSLLLPSHKHIFDHETSQAPTVSFENKHTPQASSTPATGIVSPMNDLTQPLVPITIPLERLSNEKIDISTDRKLNMIEAPHVEHFYGRDEELAELKHWVVEDHCKVVAVLGIGGIGKTSLVVKLIDQVQATFVYIFWCSLKNAPTFTSVLRNSIQFFSHQRQTVLSEDIEGQISLLIECLKEQRCLWILDNLESILQEGHHAGQFREGYEAYGMLLERVGSTKHQSCILLTSREKPKEIIPLEGDTKPVRSFHLIGLDPTNGIAILKDKSLNGTEKIWRKLINKYSGNPLALNLAAGLIRETFGGNIASFLDANLIGSDVADLLEKQFRRLSNLELMIIYWLAIEREALPLTDLAKNLIPRISNLREVSETLYSLRRRSMIERGDTGFSLQNVIMEYTTDLFIDLIVEEIKTEKLTLFRSHSLMKALAKDYVRESQLRLILKTILSRLTEDLGEVSLREKFGRILSTERDTYPRRRDYMAGNVLNLLIQLGENIQGYDFSNLAIWQAYLRGAFLSNANFASADFARCAFTDTFGSILSVSLSSNGELLAAGTVTGEIWLWNISNDTLYLTYQGHTDWVRTVAFSPDSSILASGGEDEMVYIWEVSTGKRLNALKGHNNWIRALAFSPDGKLLATACDDHYVRLWEVETGNLFKILGGLNSPVYSVAFNPDGNILAGANEDKTIYIWEITTKEKLMILQGHTSWVWSVAFSSDGKLLASGSDDQTVRLWEVETGQPVKTLQGHTDGVKSVTFSSDGKLLASGSDDQTVRLWEIETGQPVKTLQGHRGWVWSVVFSSDGKLLASGSDDQTVRLWEVETGQSVKTLQGHSNIVHSVAIDSSGTLLGSGNEDQTVRLWEVKTGQLIKTLQGYGYRVGSVAFNPKGNILAGASDDQTVRLWNAGTGECFQILQGHLAEVRSVAFSPDGKLLASGSEDQTIRLWETSSGVCIGLLQVYSTCLRSLAFSPDGNLLANGSSDQNIHLWNMSTKQRFNTLKGHKSVVGAVIFSPDGKLLASGSEDQTIRLWDTNTWQCLKTLQDHTGSVHAIAFSPDGDLLATGGSDQTVRLWDTNTWQCLKTLRGHTNTIWSITFSKSDGNIIASSGDDGTIRFWSAKTGENLKMLRADRPYERMNITAVTGLTNAQKATLLALGAVEDTQGQQKESSVKDAVVSQSTSSSTNQGIVRDTKLQQVRDQIFISYSHKDVKWLDRLQVVIKPLIRGGVIKIWADTQIEVGDKWHDEINKALAVAKVAILLVTPNFLHSDFIVNNELPSLLNAAEKDGLTIFWIAVSASMYKETEITKYQCANNPSKPLDNFPTAELNRELVRIGELIKKASV